MTPVAICFVIPHSKKAHVYFLYFFIALKEVNKPVTSSVIWQFKDLSVVGIGLT